MTTYIQIFRDPDPKWLIPHGLKRNWLARNSCVESLEAKFCVRTGTGPEFPGVGRVQTCGGAVECRGGEEVKVWHEILPRLDTPGQRGPSGLRRRRKVATTPTDDGWEHLTRQQRDGGIILLVLNISTLTCLFLNGVDNDRAGLKRPGPDCLGGMWALGRSQVRPTNYSGTVKPWKSILSANWCHFAYFACIYAFVVFTLWLWEELHILWIEEYKCSGTWSRQASSATNSGTWTSAQKTEHTETF